MTWAIGKGCQLGMGNLWEQNTPKGKDRPVPSTATHHMLVCRTGDCEGERPTLRGVVALRNPDPQYCRVCQRERELLPVCVAGPMNFVGGTQQWTDPKPVRIEPVLWLSAGPAFGGPPSSDIPSMTSHPRRPERDFRTGNPLLELGQSGGRSRQLHGCL